VAGGDGGVAIELIEDDGPHGPDTGGGLALRIAREMGVARGGLDPGVAQEFPYHGKPLAERQGARGERMPEVVNTDVMKPRTPPSWPAPASSRSMTMAAGKQKNANRDKKEHKLRGKSGDPLKNICNLYHLDSHLLCPPKLLSVRWQRREGCLSSGRYGFSKTPCRRYARN